MYFIHRDPEAWENPEKYDPERLRGPAKEARHAFQFLPIGDGPRNCIRMRFALMEIKIALVKILMKFKFERSPETQVGNSRWFHFATKRRCPGQSFYSLEN